MHALPHTLGPDSQLEVLKVLLDRPDRVVCQVWDVRTQRPLALKAVKAPRHSLEGRALIQELLQLQRWQHPMLPRAGGLELDLPVPGKDGRWLAFTQEWLEGPSLRQLLSPAGTCLDIAAVETLAERLLSLLLWLEEASLAGLDLKPEHLILTAEGWKVLDLEQVQPENPLRARSLAGTLRYAAPEVLDELPADTRSDLYSVGRVLLEALTGTLSMPVGDSLAAMARSIRKAPPLPEPAPPVLTTLGMTAPGLAALLPGLLAPDPSNRPTSVREALACLGAGLDPVLMRAGLPLPPVRTRGLQADGTFTAAPGQGEALSVLTNTYERLCAGQGHPGFVLSGPAGAGHSRFMQDTLLHWQLEAKPHGRGVLLVRPEGSQAGPFSAVQRVLEFLQHLTPEVSQVPEPAGAESAALDWSARAGRLARQIAQTALAVATALAPVVVLIDDVQALDEPSQQVLAQLLPLLPDARLLWVMAPPPARATDASTIELAGKLQKALALLEPLTLPPLTEAQARALAEAHLQHQPLTAPIFAALFSTTRGLAGRFVRGLTALWRNPTLDPSTGDPAEPEASRQTLPAASLSTLRQWAEEAAAEGQLLRARGLLLDAQAQAVREGADEQLQGELQLRGAELSLALEQAEAALEGLEQVPEGLGLDGRVLAVRVRALKSLGRLTIALQALESAAVSPAPDPFSRLPLEEQLALRQLQVWLNLAMRRAESATHLLRQLRPLLTRVEGRSGGQGYSLVQRSYEVWARMYGAETSSPELKAQLTEELKGLLSMAQRLHRRSEVQRVRVLLAEWGQSQGLPETRQWLEAVVTEARQGFELADEASGLNNLARFLRRTGDFLAAQEALSRAEAVYGRLQDKTNQTRVQLQLTELYLRASRQEAARLQLTRAQGLLKAGADANLEPWMRWLEAQLNCKRGVNPATGEQLELAFMRLLSTQQHALALPAGVEVLEAWLTLGQPERARQVGQLLAGLVQPGSEAWILQRYYQGMAQATKPTSGLPPLSQEATGATPGPDSAGPIQETDLTWLDRMEFLLTNGQDSPRLAEALADTLVQLLGGRALVLLEGPQGPVLAHTGLNLLQLEDVSKSVVTRVLQEQQLWTCPDLLANLDNTGESVRDKGYRSVVCAPIVQGSRSVGVLYVDHKQVGAVTSTRAVDAIRKVARLGGFLLASLDPDLQEAVEDDLPSFGLIGNSPLMRRLRREILRLSRSTSPELLVMLRGEVGVGKSTLARILHTQWGLPTNSLVPCDLRNLPETLIEAELFGYGPGAFTGGDRRGRAGKFEQAHGGTLFLDEVQNLPLSLQERLLTPLSERQVTRMGTSTPVKFSARLVVAASRDLRELRDEGKFLPALVGRLWKNPVVVPALRERGPDDIQLLLEHYVRREAGLGEREKVELSRYFAKETLQFLLRYDWPGNVRELENLFESALVQEQVKARAQLRLTDIEDLLQTRLTASELQVSPAAVGADSLPAAGQPIAWVWKEFLLPLQTRYVQRELSLQGTKVKTAATLKVTRTTLDKLLLGEG